MRLSFVSDVSWIALFLASSTLWDQSVATGKDVHFRYEYKYAFKGPHLTQPDLTVPFWTLLGDTIAGDEQIRMVPSIRDKKGVAWSNQPFPHEEWVVEVHVRVAGRGKIGADGLAIWYTSSTGGLGPVYGSEDYWTGIGVFLDSFDNDNRMDNPMISVVMNDGTKEYQHGSDGIEQHSGSCKMDFRNRPYPVKIRVKYFQKTLSVSYSAGNLENDEYYACTTIENVEIPPNYFFGVSAATGGLADDHDVLKFLTWSISDTLVVDLDQDTVVESRKRVQEDYEKKLEDFKKMQEEYKQQHPTSPQQQNRPDELYEGTASEEIRSLFEIQNSIKQDIRSLSDFLGHLLEQQNSMLLKVESMQVQSGEVKPAAGADDSAKRYHIDNVLNLQRETYDAVKGVRDSLSRLEQSISSLDYQVQQQREIRSGGGNKNLYGDVHEKQVMIEQLQAVQNTVTTLLELQPVKPTLVCPDVEMPSCISVGLFVAIASVQVVILLVYHSMRAAREDAAKKFF